jgi:starch phosphorylase
VHVTADPASLFDIQVKRMHAYKRQLLNVMHIVHEYLALIEDGQQPPVARTYVFAGKAAPGYWVAKQFIKLIHNVGRVINNDARASAWIKVAFLPDYRVSLAEKIIPAADLSEQISTAGMEASGTSNMKFALNGALTIGTLDGATIEILEEVGAENIFIFGLTAGEVQALRAQRSYRPRDYYERDPRVKRVAEALRSPVFCPREPDLFAWIYQAILDEHDAHVHLADLPAYLEAQDKASAAFNDRAAWTRMAILNVARIGKFSSDRTVEEYARDIWDIKRVEVPATLEESSCTLRP